MLSSHVLNGFAFENQRCVHIDRKLILPQSLFMLNGATHVFVTRLSYGLFAAGHDLYDAVMVCNKIRYLGYRRQDCYAGDEMEFTGQLGGLIFNIVGASILSRK